MPYVFDKTDIIGSGLKITDTGYYPKTCLKKFESDVSGGTLDIGFIKIDTYKSDTDLPLDNFVRKSIERAGKVNIRHGNIESFLLTVSIKDRISTIREESMEFRDDVKEILLQPDAEKFFRTCGTDYIRTVVFDSEIYLFVSFYPKSAEEMKKIGDTVRKRINTNKNDVIQIRLFDDLDFSPDTYFSLQTNTGNMFEPVEFFFKELHKEKIDALLNRLLISIINSNKGRVKNFYTGRWSGLDLARVLNYNRKDIDIIKYSPEAIFSSLSLLENSVRQFALGYERLKKTMPYDSGGSDSLSGDCYNSMAEISKSLNWEEYYKCRAEAVTNNTVNPDFLPACQAITQSIKKVNTCNKYLNIKDIKAPDSLIPCDKIYLPMELADRDIKDPMSIHQKDTDYRFNDKEQLENLPPAVELGHGMDINAVEYPDSCIVENTKHLSSTAQRDTRVTNDYYPSSFRKQNPLIFWKDSPERVLYRGSFEIEGYSDKLLPDFEITEDAKKLASEDISAFYRKYGTHYINQIQHRRGFVYYFSMNSPDDKDIEIIPYGMTEPEAASPVPEGMFGNMPGLMESGCCLIPQLDILNIFNSGQKPPEVLKPKTVNEFFSSRTKIIQLFESDKKAIPIRISLEPWSEYLLDRGILKPHQLDLK